MLDIKRDIWNLGGWGARIGKPDTEGSVRGRSDPDSFTQGGGCMASLELQLWMQVWVSEGQALDLRGPPWSRAAPPWDFPAHPRCRVPGPNRNSPCAGIPRAPRFAACPASEPDTCGARACGAELGGGRFPCVSAVTSARGVLSRGFPCPRLALTLLALASKLGICSSWVEETGLAGPRGR